MLVRVGKSKNAGIYGEIRSGIVENSNFSRRVSQKCEHRPVCDMSIQ